ncbi:hypothetical protein EVAR_87240_1 [Eumeta japonica]|uniref:Uncharacterized protein n=1 Tax=Eumeta variegata TaxID=151549 RepID=A0A4C1YPB8_EUMVA|nr:hypothetical protein EVAR_87240_1 [Eumeta japonica]
MTYRPRYVLTLALGHPSNQSDIIHIRNKMERTFFPNLLELHIHANQDTRQEKSDEPKLDEVASFNYGVPCALRLHRAHLNREQHSPRVSQAACAAAPPSGKRPKLAEDIVVKLTN